MLSTDEVAAAFVLRSQCGESPFDEDPDIELHRQALLVSVTLPIDPDEPLTESELIISMQPEQDGGVTYDIS